jgi:hypothetical protein
VFHQVTQQFLLDKFHWLRWNKVVDKLYENDLLYGRLCVFEKEVVSHFRNHFFFFYLRSRRVDEKTKQLQRNLFNVRRPIDNLID